MLFFTLAMFNPMDLREPSLRDILDAIHESDHKHEQRFEQIDQRLTEHDQRFDEVFEVIQALSTHVDGQINDLRLELRTEFNAGLNEVKTELAQVKTNLLRVEKKVDLRNVELSSLHIRVAHLESAS